MSRAIYSSTPAKRQPAPQWAGLILAQQVGPFLTLSDLMFAMAWEADVMALAKSGLRDDPDRLAS